MNTRILLAGLILLLAIGVVFFVRVSHESYSPDTSNLEGSVSSGSSISIEDNSLDDGLEINGSSSSGSTSSIEVNSSKDVVDSSGVPLSELAKHNSEDDCWVSYDGKVYDITSFLPRHPGGVRAISRHCGTSEDFSNAFTGQHGTSKVSMLMKVGVFIGDFDIVGKVA